MGVVYELMKIKDAKKWLEDYTIRTGWYRGYANDHPEELKAYAIIFNLLLENEKLKKALRK